MFYRSPRGVRLPLNGFVNVVGPPASGKTELIEDMTHRLHRDDEGSWFEDEDGTEFDCQSDGGLLLLGIPLNMRRKLNDMLYLNGDSKDFRDDMGAALYMESLKNPKVSHLGAFGAVEAVTEIHPSIRPLVAAMAGPIPATTSRRQVEMVADRCVEMAEECRKRVTEIKELEDKPYVTGSLPELKGKAIGSLDRATFEISQLEATIRANGPIKEGYKEIDEWRLKRAKAKKLLDMIHSEEVRQSVLLLGDEEVDKFQEQSNELVALSQKLNDSIVRTKGDNSAFFATIKGNMQALGIPLDGGLSSWQTKARDVAIRAAICKHVGWPWLIVDGLPDPQLKLSRWLDTQDKHFRAVIRCSWSMHMDDKWRVVQVIPRREV